MDLKINNNFIINISYPNIIRIINILYCNKIAKLSFNVIEIKKNI